MHGVTVLIVEQNVRMALLLAEYGYIIRDGRHPDGRRGLAAACISRSDNVQVIAFLGGSVAGSARAEMAALRSRIAAREFDFSDGPSARRSSSFGLTIGVVYGIVALGISLIYSGLDIVHFAHGEVYMFGAFFGHGVHRKHHVAFHTPLALLGPR